MRILVIKLSALGAFLGGPLFVADLLEPTLGRQIAFAIAFAPIGVATLCLLWVLEERPTPFVRFLAVAGGLGCLGLVGMDAFALSRLWTGTHHPNATMIQFGCACALVATPLYFLQARRLFARPGPLDKEELLRIAADVWEGKRPQSDLAKHGLSFGEKITGEAAKQKLLAELGEGEKGDEDES